MYLIVDHLDLIKEWDKGAMILQFLFSLYSVLKMPQLGLILEVLDFHMSTSAKYLPNCCVSRFEKPSNARCFYV